MHEMSIATHLIGEILDVARANHLVSVSEVDVEVGVQRLVVPEALQLCFEAVREGTVAEGARLRIVEVPARAECRSCGMAFEPEIDCYACPRCGLADVRFTAGADIILKSISGETD